MEGSNEIQFLLNFDFEGAGSKEAEDFLTRLIAYTGDFNDITKLTSAELDKLKGRLEDNISVQKKLADVLSQQTGVSKENMLVAKMSFEETRNNQKAIEDLINSKTKLIKTEEQLTGELNKASAQVRLLSGHLLEMDTTGKRVGEGYIKTISLLKDWTAQVEKSKTALRDYNTTQSLLNDTIEGARARLAECKTQLEQFSFEESKSSEKAIALKAEINQLNVSLKELGVQTSGQLELEQALNNTRAANIKLTNELAAIELRSVEAKAALIIREQQYAAEVANRVNVSLTGYTLEEEAALKKGIAEEEAFDKAWLLGQQWLRQQEEIYDKAWRAGEEYQIKKAQGEQASFDKAWALGQMWLRQQEENFDKAWRLGEEYQAKQQASFNKAWRDGEDWQRKQAEVTEAAEARKAAAIEKTTILYKLQTYIVRDLFRVVAATLTIIPIMALLSWIVDFTKAIFGFGEATERAEESIRKFNTSIADGATDINEKMQEETQSMRVLIQTSQDLNTSYENRVSSINKVRDAYGELLDKYSDVEIAENKQAKDDRKKADSLKEKAEQSKADYTRILKDIADRKKQVNDDQAKLSENENSWIKGLLLPETISLRKAIKRNNTQILIDEADLPSTKKEYEDADKSYRDFIHPVNNNLKISKYKAMLAEVQRQNESTDYSKYGLTPESTAEDVRKMKSTNTQYQSDTSYQIQEIRRLKDTIAELEGNKDPKGRVGKQNRELEEARALEKARNKGKVDDINTAFDVSPQSDLDRQTKYDSLLKQAADHADKMEAIIVQYAKKTKDSKTKLATYRQEDEDDFKKTNAAILAEGNKDVLASQKYNEEKVKQIVETRKKLEAAAEAARQAQESQDNRNKSFGRASASARFFNPIQAFFGGGAEDTTQDRKDRDKDALDLIDKTKDDKDVAYAKLLDAQGAERKAKSQVDLDSAIQNPGVLQKQTLQENRGVYEKAVEARAKTEDEYRKASVSADDAVQKHTLDNLTDAQKDKVKIAEAVFNATEKIAESAFAAQQKRIQITMQSTQAMYALENTLAGNNAAARIRLALAEHAEMLKLKREEAKSQKAQAIFGAVTNTAVAVTKALTGSPAPASFILAAITGAAGLVEINEIQKQPLPSYRGGRKGGKAEFAQINEEGLEIIESKKGSMRIQAGNYAFLEEGDTVHTHKESQKYLKDIQKGVNGYEVTKTGQLKAIYQGISKKDMEEVMSKAISKLPQPTAPAQGVQDRLIRTQLRNGR